MNKPYEIIGESILCFSDVHQKLDWARAVIEHEKGNFDKLVFMGDITDSFNFPPEVSGIKECGIFYKWLIDNHYVILGNHCLPLMESWGHNKKFSKKIPLLNYCSGFTNNKSIEFNKQLTWEDWRKVKLFYVVNGWLVSHAGFREHLWYPFKSTEENLEALWHDADFALENIQIMNSPLFACGYARGGSANRSGCVWLDWGAEFEDNLPLPQIVGHSHNHNCIRQIGKSYCIDTGISYALINRSGEIKLKSLSKQKENINDHVSEWKWKEFNCEIVNNDNIVKSRNAPYDPKTGSTFIID